ncbi:MAG: TonB-dependent receptor [Haliea sp.]|nr:TonB-dependent receptor [Haliea sp.]
MSLPRKLTGVSRAFRHVEVILLASLLGVFAGTAAAQETKSKGYNLQLEEVMVTAQRREQDTMTVPITVSAFTSQDMINTGADNIQDISDFMPGVDIGEGGATQVTIAIRGISSPNISSGGDPSVATFYDNAYMPRAATSIPFTDIARTEVLKGPQGTLFGRNATAGVINIVPNQPVQEFEGFLKSRVGNYELLNVEGMVNQPLTDELAMRANIFSHQRDGVIENIGIGDNLREEGFIASRLVFLYDLSPDTSLQLAGDYEDRKESPGYSIGVSKYAVSTDPFNSEAANDVVDREENRDMYGVSLQGNHAFNDELSVFGIVSYRDWKTWNKQDEDGTEDPRRYIDTNNIEESNIWYNEVRFNFVNDKFNVVTGGNYSVEDVYQRTDIGLLADSYMQFISLELLPEVGIPASPDNHAWDYFPNEPDSFWLSASQLAGSLVNPPLPGIAVLPPSFAGDYFTETMDNTGDFTNWGIFGDVTYNLTDTVRLSAGLRYSYDDKTYSWQTFSQLGELAWPYEPARVAYDPAQTGAPPADYFNKFEDSKDWSKTTGRLVLDWTFMENAMTYLSYATGYKSGGFDGQVFSAYVAGPFEPEEMASTELGMKGDFFDSRLRIETSLFYQNLDGQQTSAETKNCIPGMTQQECNDYDLTSQPTIVSQDVDTEGVEIMAQWQAIESLLLTGMTTVRDAETTPEAYFNGDGEARGGSKQTDGTNTDYTLRLDWTPVIPMGYLLVHVDYVFESADDDSDVAIYTTGPWYFQDREILSARIAWTNDADNFEVAIWGRNLQDNEIADNPGGYVASTLGAYRTSIEDPLTYGVDLRYSF